MRLFSFQGRISRADYARVIIGAYVAMIPIGLVMTAGAHSIDATFPMTGIRAAVADVALPVPLAWVVALGGLALIFAILFMFVSIDVRRFHDWNLSGWFLPLWMVVWYFLPDRELGDLMPSLTGLIWIAVMITVPGTQGANRYGPDPTADEEVTAG